MKGNISICLRVRLVGKYKYIIQRSFSDTPYLLVQQQICVGPYSLVPFGDSVPLNSAILWCLSSSPDVCLHRSSGYCLLYGWYLSAAPTTNCWLILIFYSTTPKQYFLHLIFHYPVSWDSTVIPGYFISLQRDACS